MIAVPAHVREQMLSHAERERPREACGLVAVKRGTARAYLEGANRVEGAGGFLLEMPDPSVWLVEHIDGWQLAVFHSHTVSGAQPSRLDRQTIMASPGRIFMIMGADRDLRAFVFDGEQVAEQQITER